MERTLNNTAPVITLFIACLLLVSPWSEALAGGYRYYYVTKLSPKVKHSTAAEACEMYRAIVEKSSNEANPGGTTTIKVAPSGDKPPDLRTSEPCVVNWTRTVEGKTSSFDSWAWIMTGGCYQGRYPQPGVEFPSEPFFCVGQVYCPAPYVLNSTGTQCEAYCPTGDQWNANTSSCDSPPDEQTCETQGTNPIDYIKGRKYRTELVMKTGNRFPIVFSYYYNNHSNNENTSGSAIAHFNVSRFLAATRVPMVTTNYQSQYLSNGLPKLASYVHPAQHYGSVLQYWRHSFDEVLQVRGEEYVYHSAKGQRIGFAGLGYSNTYPALSLQLLGSGEESFAGYKLENSESGSIKKFDSSGKLREWQRSPQDVLTLSYDSQGRLKTIANNEAASLTLMYQSLPTESIYSVNSSEHDYPVKVIAESGDERTLSWDHVYQGQTSKFHMLTGITDAVSETTKVSREFAYSDSRWPASLTDIYDTVDFETGEKQLYAHFEYDGEGRAVYSGLAGGADAEHISYVNNYSRIVTNALGKKATYQFADIDGVTRLQSVTGEPTQNCVKSEIAYTYDSAGNIEEKIRNGVTTHYQYDSQNREIARTEASRTPDARTITTEWHPTLNVKTKITEPGRETIYTYDANGNLTNQTTRPLATQ